MKLPRSRAILRVEVEVEEKEAPIGHHQVIVVKSRCTGHSGRADSSARSWTQPSKSRAILAARTGLPFATAPSLDASAATVVDRVPRRGADRMCAA
jgi:hypothetical protein